MGPRPFSRGNARILRSSRRRRNASMGPRPFSRGNLFIPSWWKYNPPGFNGAATFQPRKPQSPSDSPDSQGGFNGAATFQPRKRLAWIAPQSHATLLQWGRDLSAAETCTGRRQSRNPMRLQWGRDLSAAETPLSVSDQTIGEAELQWGRDLSAAETPIRRGRQPWPRCFNGAATFQPRKRDGTRNYPCSSGRFNGAATFQPRKLV